MIAHLQRAATTAALIPALYGPDDPHRRLRPRLIGADYRGADKQLPLFGDPQEVLGGGVLDAPAQRIGARAPERPVWMCSVRSDPGHPDLSDAQWAEVARRLVSATGLAPAGDPKGCRWAAIRNLDHSVHIVATVVREDGRIHGTYRDAFHVQAECNRIAAELGHLTRTVPSVTTAKDYRMPTPAISISIEPSGSVSAKGSSDDLSAALLKHAGFQEKADWYGRRHRLPTTTAHADRVAVATHAAEMLRAARYNVDLDPKLDPGRLTTPTDPQGLKAAGRQVLELADQIRGASSAADAANALDQLLDPDDGVLARLREALEAAAEQVTDLAPDEYELSDRFSSSAELIGTAEAELADTISDLRTIGAAPAGPEPGQPVQAADSLRTRAALARSAAAPAPRPIGPLTAAVPARAPSVPAASAGLAGRAR
ncbi:hypothetical protein [Streptomyces sp. CBMA123]|uniref:hypothetical protein n=1 Tax=Streptomyces sp. CBMA123 TaxID=1896313 RepID=UPI0016620C17|nr:hypothetical protein [Streptomyces sp. CBMA123]